MWPLGGGARPGEGEKNQKPKIGRPCRRPFQGENHAGRREGLIILSFRHGVGGSAGNCYFAALPPLLFSSSHVVGVRV